MIFAEPTYILVLCLLLIIANGVVTIAMVAILGVITFLKASPREHSLSVSGQGMKEDMKRAGRREI